MVFHSTDGRSGSDAEFVPFSFVLTNVHLFHLVVHVSGRVGYHIPSNRLYHWVNLFEMFFNN